MKKRYLLAVLALALVFPAGAFAITSPGYDQPVPAEIDANTYTFKFHIEMGATVTVVGGPADIAPVTDGVGNKLDGIVEVQVGLAQNQKNVFSVFASKGDERSEVTLATIQEKSRAAETIKPIKGDVTPPAPPLIDAYSPETSQVEITLSGSTEADANIYARRKKDGILVGSGRADSHGVFSIQVRLQRGKTNEISVSAEDAAGNEGEAAAVSVTVARVAPATVKTVREPRLPQERTPKFADTRGHWAEEYIKSLYEKSVVAGKSETRFDPDERVTRAELTKMALKAFNYEIPATVEKAPFLDVSADAWYAPYIEVAKNEGIINGENGRFHPDAFINRAAALKILLEASKLAQVDTDKKVFHDVPAQAWFHRYVLSAAAYNIVSGYADGTFRPGGMITRAEVSKIIVKLSELTGK